MNLSIINQVLHNNDFEHPKFFHQLFKLLEDVRIFEHIRQQRPSTTKMIDLRIETRLSFTESQINFYKTKTVYTDLLFLYLETCIFKSKLFNIPSIHPAFDDIFSSYVSVLTKYFQNQTSEDNMYLAERIMYQVDDLLKEDMLNEYYYLPQKII